MAFIIKDDKIIGLTEYGKDLKEIVIPSFVKEIGKSAFRGAKVEKVVFEDGSNLVKVGDSAFRDCANLVDVTLPSSVVEVGELAFYNTKQTSYDRLYQKNIKEKKYYAPKYTYEFMGEDVLPIGAYIEPSVGYFAPDVNIDWHIKEFVQSGCNLMICIGQTRYGTTKEHYHEIFKTLEKYGAMVMVKDELESDKVDYDVAHEVGYASLAGWHVVDEPGTSLWNSEHVIHVVQDLQKDPNAKPRTISRLADREEWAKKYPRKLFYINLLPINSPKVAFVLGAEDWWHEKNHGEFWEKQGYEKLAEPNYYYKSYMDNVRPDVFSYDFYPLWANGLGCDAHLFYPELNARHFEQLAIVRKYCQEYSIKSKGEETPFWNFIEISAWGNSRSGARCPIMSEVEWQINTAFAFGSKGYQYFCYNDYGDVTGNNGPCDTTIETPINRDGTINEDVYAMVRLANARAQAMAKWILNASVDHLIQVGPNPNDEVIEKESFIPRDKDFKWRLKESFGKNHLISCMKYYANNNDYVEGVPGDVQELYLVCNNSNRAINNGAITLKFKKKVTGKYIYDKKEYDFCGKTLTVETAAGEGFAVLLDK